MFASPLRAVTLAAAALGLSACTAGYGSGLSVGIGNGYYDPYYSGYGYNGYGYDGYPAYASGYGSGYPSYGYGYGYPSYYGWYDGYYYPGTGYYVYDQYRRPHRWSNTQQRYWTERQRTFRGATRSNIGELRDNWQDFRRDRRRDDRAFRVERRDDRAELRRGTVTREEFRADRRTDRRAYRVERREDRRELRRENREDGARTTRVSREQRQATRAERRQARQERRENRDGDDD